MFRTSNRPTNRPTDRPTDRPTYRPTTIWRWEFLFLKQSTKPWFSDPRALYKLMALEVKTLVMNIEQNQFSLLANEMVCLLVILVALYTEHLTGKLSAIMQFHNIKRYWKKLYRTHRRITEVIEYNRNLIEIDRNWSKSHRMFNRI